MSSLALPSWLLKVLSDDRNHSVLLSWYFLWEYYTLLFIHKTLTCLNLIFLCDCRCHAVNVYDDDAYVYSKINEELQAAGLPVQAEDIIDVIGGHHLPGYGRPTQEDLGSYISSLMHHCLRSSDSCTMKPWSPYKALVWVLKASVFQLLTLIPDDQPRRWI